MKNLIASIMILLLILSFSVLVDAAKVTGQINIQANVIPTLKFKILKEKHKFRIKKSDLENGYKNEKNGTIISVITNNANGYIMSISPQLLLSDTKNNINQNVYTYVRVMVNGESFGVKPGGSIEIPFSPNSSSKNITILNYRFTLSPGIEVGRYSWPIVVTVYPM